MRFQGGLLLAADLGRAIAIQHEALYTMKGATWVALDDSTTFKLYADCIEVPPLIRIRTPGRGVQPFLFGGPTVGFDLREKLASNGAEGPLEEAPLKNDDHWAIVGTGLDLGSPSMSATARGRRRSWPSSKAVRSPISGTESCL